MHVEWEMKLGFKDVLIKPKRSTLKSRSEVSLKRSFQFKHSGSSWEGIPIMASNMDTIGTIPMATALSQQEMITVLHKHYSLEEWRRFLSSLSPSMFSYLSVSTGITTSDLEKIHLLVQEFPQIPFLCLDVANGYTEVFVDQVKRLRGDFPKQTIIAGNVVTPEMTEELIISGADIVKVGIGPGSVCTTRVKTGVGYPQVSAIMECADAAHGVGGHVISDGGCTSPGDLAKAFAAGADFVMLGGMLSGHKEGGGEIIERDGKKFMELYGMSSQTAMNKHSGGVANYRASEGKSVLVPFRGSVVDTLRDLLGGIRSTCTYVGASRLKELTKRATFIRVAEQENRVFSD